MAVNSSDIQEERNGLDPNADQYLTFTVADEEYGVDILKVQEIKGYVPTTRIPNAPPEVVGVLNLRGTIVPIVDMRSKFDLDAADYTPFTVIVVLVVQGRVMGIIVDAVSDVINIPAKDIEPAPDFGYRGVAQSLKGMGKVGEKLVILLDIDALLLGESSAMAA
ncbi:MAG: chemotaxis protein CheW [Armatimonadetes bacterium 55-13]|mgnify:CR=1 FL=1|nr:purine-binding chemotaxis protein CheW [Armatimonadota bacterium]OJU62830.1 MAG: chemotaxis protein CheW [Armatimonadetes bacterium 55-13]